MNRQELISEVAVRTGSTKAQAAAFLEATLETIADTIKSGEKVLLVGFGVFDARVRRERSGRNPQTGEPITIPAKRVPVFTAGSLLKERVG